MEMTIHTIIDDAARDIARCATESSSIIARMADALIACFERGGKVLICGNGGSAAEAQHFAAEFINKIATFRKALPALALTTDSSAITSIGNDLAFEDIFSRQVEALGSRGDILWGLSTSGRSANVIKAFAAARAAGLTCIAFCGRPGSDMEAQAELALTVSSGNTARIQEVHLVAGHVLCELVERHYFNKGQPA
jgi:D-sedoheptulose 7-phosphate isomerase